MNILFLAQTLDVTPHFTFWDYITSIPWWMKIVIAVAIISGISRFASAAKK